MSLIQVAAPFIRLAAADDYQAQDLRDAVADQHLFTELVTAEIEQRELASMNPTEWRWYARWRQALGGELDPVVLKHLEVSATTRFARFEVRALVLRDPRTNEVANTLDGDPPSDNVGLNWLREQARNPQVDAGELCNDLLQCATEASRFLAKQLLTSPDKDRGALARGQLGAFMEEHEIAGEIRERWGLEF